MHALHEIQRRCYQAFVHGHVEVVLALLADPDPATGIGVYQNNAMEGFRKTLAASFPVIERLTGEACFRTLSRDYMRACPSRSGNLETFGASFPEFLSDLYEGSAYTYLADVAHLEWACEEARVAPDAPGFDPRVLQGFTPETAAAIRLRFHPSCRVVRSAWPVLSIWRANSGEASSEQVVHLDAGAESVLVCRNLDGLTLRLLPAADGDFVDAILGGATLAEAYQAASATDPGFDPGAPLRRFLTWGVLAAAPPSHSSNARGIPR